MIGNLRTQLGLYEAEFTPDDLGGRAAQWLFLGSLWAEILPRSSQTRSLQGNASVVQTYKVIIRYRDNFPERARLLWGQRPLRVIAASDPDTRKERLHLICEEEQE